jgi:hypothetical protein
MTGQGSKLDLGVLPLVRLVLVSEVISGFLRVYRLQY